LILVLCGTQKQSFVRLVQAVEKLATANEIIIQAGHTQYASNQMEIFDFATKAELATLYEKADYIITHAGAGSMLQAVKAKKKTLAFPRLKKYGEHVDDHQLQLAKKLEALQYLLVFNDGDQFIDVFARLSQFKPKTYQLQGKLTELIDDTLDAFFNNR